MRKKVINKSLLEYLSSTNVKIPKDVELSPQDIKTIFLESNKKNGKPKVAIYMKLIKEYHYKPSQLKFDYELIGATKITTLLTVFRDDTTKELPFIVVIDNYPSDTNVINTLLENGVKFVIRIKEKEFETYVIDSERKKLEKIEDIPTWVDKKPLKQFLPKSKILLPFQDEHHLRSVVFRCHTIINENTGQDPSRAFDEFTKILLIKIYDEKNSNKDYRFCVLKGETPKAVGKRVRELLKEALQDPTFSRIFDGEKEKGKIVSLELNDFGIYEIVLELQPYSISYTSEVVNGSDIKGRVYEKMVGRTFRGGLGQYYTPRTIANFMVEFLEPTINDRILDPACGTGGFFISVINYLKKKLRKDNPTLSKKETYKIMSRFIDNNIFGIDIYDRICRVARLNLVMHGSTKPNVFNMNGLLVGEIPNEIKKIFKDNTFNIVLSNPPFAGYIKDPKILSQFDLGKRGGKPRSVTKEVLFIEKIIKLLDYGGKAGLVLPLGIFNNPSLKFVREYLFKHVKIIGVVGLPEYAFTHTGTSVKGALLFIEKVKEVPRDYEIFFANAKNIGYDSTGREIPENDFPKILKAFKNKDKSYFIKFSQIKDRIDPQYYSKRYDEIIKKISSSKYPIVPLSSIIEFSKDTINPRKFPNKKFRYLETGSLDLENGKIISIREFFGKEAPTRAKYIGKAGDILVPTARESLVGVFILPPELEGIIISSRFIVCRPKNNVDRMFLFYLLKQKEILELLKRECTGEIVPSISEKSFDNILVPLPPLNEQVKIVKKMKDYENRINEYERKIRKMKESMKEFFTSYLFTS